MAAGRGEGSQELLEKTWRGTEFGVGKKFRSRLTNADRLEILQGSELSSRREGELVLNKFTYQGLRWIRR